MDKTADAPRIEVQDIDHLGIVAGIIDETGLVEEIDRRVGTHPQEHLSCGRAVKAMILNGLGFLSAPLYLFEEFFSGKATEHLIGPGVKPEHLNDDRLGRVLDKLSDAWPHRGVRGRRQQGLRALGCARAEECPPRRYLFPPSRSLRRRRRGRRGARARGDPHNPWLLTRAPPRS